MIVIHKKELLGNDRQAILLPEGAKIIHVGNQHENVCLWYQWNTLLMGVLTNFRHDIYLINTGDPIEPGLHYLGTVSLFSGELIKHVFEVKS
jgi:hypothetical protein